MGSCAEVVPTNPEGIARAADALRAGGVVAYPTETVYGLGVDPFNEAAVQKLFAMKGRADGHPVLLIVADEAQLLRAVRQVSARAQTFIDAFWPGPLSLLFPKAPGVVPSVCGASKMVCARQPASPTARSLCGAFGNAVTSTSANQSGAPAARSLAEIELEGIAVCIDGGEVTGGGVSTVYDPERDQILREGKITAEELRRIRFE
jgi:L-threonylcarbamoyladenylate synthase